MAVNKSYITLQGRRFTFTTRIYKENFCETMENLGKNITISSYWETKRTTLI